MRRNHDVAILAEEGAGVGEHLLMRHRVEVEERPALPGGRLEETVVDEVRLRGELLTGAEMKRDPRWQGPVEEDALRREDELPDAEVEGQVAGFGAVRKAHGGVGRPVDVDVVTAAAHLDLHPMDGHVLLARELQIGAFGELGTALDGDRADGDLTAVPGTMHVGTGEGLRVRPRRGQDPRKEQHGQGTHPHSRHSELNKPRNVPPVKAKIC